MTHSHIKKHKKEQPTFKGHYKFTLRDINTGETEVHEYDNLITIAGFSLIGNHLTSPTPSNGILLTKCALGTGTNPITVNDTALQNEVYRNDVFSRTSINNIAYVTGAFTASEVSGTFTRAALFAGNIMFSEVAINITKTPSQTLTLDWSLTMANA